MIPLQETEKFSLFPPREVPTAEYQSLTLQRAARSLQLKNSLLTRYQNQIFNIASNTKFTDEERKAVRKDQKNYIKVFTYNHYKKFPRELFLSEKELKHRIRERRERELEQRGKGAGGKRNPVKIQEKEKEKEEKKNEAVELNREESDNSEDVPDDLGEMSELDDGAEDNGYDDAEDDGNYEEQI